MLRLFLIIIFLLFGNFVKSGDQKVIYDDMLLKNLKESMKGGTTFERTAIINTFKNYLNPKAAKVVEECEKSLKDLVEKARTLPQHESDKQQKLLDEITRWSAYCDTELNDLRSKEYILDQLEKYLKELENV